MNATYITAHCQTKNIHFCIIWMDGAAVRMIFYLFIIISNLPTIKLLNLYLGGNVTHHSKCIPNLCDCSEKSLFHTKH